MITLPQSEKSLVIRTDFSDDTKWQIVCDAIKNPKNEFDAYVDFINDTTFDNLNIADLPKFDLDQSLQTFVLLVDAITCSHIEYPLHCIDLADDFGKSFRIIPAEVWGVTANLSIANMDFIEFANSVNEDGIFRGF
jgi:hypothetical protein